MNLFGQRINNPSEPRMGGQVYYAVTIEIRGPVWRYLRLAHTHHDGLIEVLRDESRQ